MRVPAFVLLALLALLLPSQASALPLPATAGCGGTAPALTSCTTGDRVGVVLYVSIGMGTDAGGFYRGGVEAVVDHAHGRYVLRCDSTGDPEAPGGCIESGPFPVAGPLRLTCGSYELGTRTPGGRGVWDCELAFAA